MTDQQIGCRKQVWGMTESQAVRQDVTDAHKKARHPNWMTTIPHHHHEEKAQLYGGMNTWSAPCRERVKVTKIVRLECM